MDILTLHVDSYNCKQKDHIFYHNTVFWHKHSTTNNFRWQQPLLHTPLSFSYSSTQPFVWHQLFLEDWMQQDRRERARIKREIKEVCLLIGPLFCLILLQMDPAATVVVTTPQNNSNFGKEEQLKWGWQARARVRDYSEAQMTVCHWGVANIKGFRRFFHSLFFPLDVCVIHCLCVCTLMCFAAFVCPLL